MNSRLVILYIFLLFSVVDCFPYNLGDGVILLGNEQYEDVLSMTDRYIEKYPTFGFSYFLRSLAYRGIGDYNSALMDIQKCILYERKILPSYELMCVDYKLKLKLVTYQEALNEIKDVISELPTLSDLAQTVLIEIYISNNDFDKALTIIDIRLENRENDMRTIALKGLAYLKMDNEKGFWDNWVLIHNKFSEYEIFNRIEMNHALSITYEYLDSAESPLFAEFLIARIMQKKNAEKYFNDDLLKLKKNGIDLNQYIDEHIPSSLQSFLHHELGQQVNE